MNNEKIEELISKFPQGHERMHQSALFNMIIHSLVHGEDPMSIINKLTNLLEAQGKMMHKMIEKMPIEPLIVEYTPEYRLCINNDHYIWHGMKGVFNSHNIQP